MADFTALKTAIQNAIKQNGNEEITGNILQGILLSIVTTLGDSAINDLITALGNEVNARQQADGTLQQNITDEATARGNADTALSNRLGSTITAENTAADQIGAEAEAREAADTALQGLIDGITDNIENGYVYAGIATPSSTPATGKVFYLALTAGTYTNFGSTVVSQGINILKYNGSTWSLDAFIGIDDAPTPNSPKLVKSGGAFDSVMTNGSAFDISAYFASGGTLATYADLSAALTALNTLSASYKRGGMSIKYVQSSDNKYVQYRLRSDSFNTTLTNWEKTDEYVNQIFKTFDVNTTNIAGEYVYYPVDGKVYKLLTDHPAEGTFGSLKVVQLPLEIVSAEVSAYMQQLNNRIYQFIPSKILGFIDGIIESSGNVGPGENQWICNAIPLKGSIIKNISIDMKNSLRGYLCMRKNDGTFSRMALAVNTAYEIVADVDTDYYFSVKFDNGSAISISDCSGINIYVTARNILSGNYLLNVGKEYNRLEFWDTGLINNDGSIEWDYYRFIRTHLIPTYGANVSISLDSDYSGYICYYNGDGTFVSRDAISGNNKILNNSYPYFAITFKKTDNTDITVNSAYSKVSIVMQSDGSAYLEKVQKSFSTSPRIVSDLYDDSWKFSWITGTGIPTHRVYSDENQLSCPFAITAKKGSTFKVKNGYKFKIYIIDDKWNIITFTGWITTGSYTFTDDCIFIFSIVNDTVALDSFDNLADACLYSWTYMDEIVNQPILTSVPNPFFFEAMDCVEKLENECDEKSIVVGFVTDSHYNGSKTYNENLAKYWGDTAKNIKLVNSLYPMDMIIHGGDITDGYWTKADTINLMKEVRDSLMGISPMNPIMLGNHDSNYPDNIDPSQVASRLITKGEFYSRMSRYIETKVVRVEDKMYYYIDFDTIKLRFIFLDANITPNLYNMSDRRSWGYDTDQINWVQNTALDTNYQVVFFSHMGVSPEFNDLEGTNAWPVNGTSLRSVIESFISNGGVVVGLFHGHTHWDFIGKKSVSNGFNEVSTCCQKVYDNATWNVEYLEEHYGYTIPEGLTIPTRVGGEVSQDCWDIIVIHPDSRKVKLIRFGAGSDREISY